LARTEFDIINIHQPYLVYWQWKHPWHPWFFWFLRLIRDDSVGPHWTYVMLGHSQFGARTWRKFFRQQNPLSSF
jgi:hypothetical protein